MAMKLRRFWLVLIIPIIIAITLVIVFYLYTFQLPKRQKISLGDNYRIIRVHGDAHVMAGPDNNVILLPNVVSAKDNDRYIIGLRSKVESSIPEYEEQPYGYFAFNKTTKQLRIGMTPEEFRSMLSKENIGLSLD